MDARATAAGQYSLAGILVIWALAALPMGVLGWIVFPALAPAPGTDPLAAGVIRVALLTAGLAWLFVLSLAIVAREEGGLDWARVKRRIRLNVPRDPETGQARRSLWLWVLAFLLAMVAWKLALSPYADRLWVLLLPFLAEPEGYGMAAVFGSREMLERLEGAWWFLGLFLLNAAFNTVLGEELLFRGVLLPRMEGVFGRWAWAANAVLFGLYHLHQPWGMAASAVGGMLMAYPCQRWRSIWPGIVIHSLQSVYFAFLILGVVLGLA